MIGDFPIVKRQTSIAVAALLQPYMRSRIRLAKKPLWLFANRYINWRGLDLMATTADGSLMRVNTRDLIQQHIYWFGVWEPALSAFLRAWLRPADTFIDVGANVGYFSLLAARRVGAAGHVVAIEAAPPIFTMLERNIALNDGMPIRAANAAATAETSEVTITMGSEVNIGSTSLRGGKGKAYTVHGAPLAVLLTANEMAEARAFKIDIEGAEAPVLAELCACLDRLRYDVAIIVEVRPDEFGGSLPGMLDRFRAAGFVQYELQNTYGIEEYVAKDNPAMPVRSAAPPDRQCDLLLLRGA
jgi:FkbM family methyltransferase